MKKILVPTDFSNNALKAALYAAEIARKSGATLFFVHASELGHEHIHQPFPLHKKYSQLVREQRMAELKQFTTTVTDVYKDINTGMELLRGSAVDAIVNCSHHNHVDLIVMGTKGASGIKEVVMGSVTANVIARSNIPVLAIPDEYMIEEPDALLLAINHFEQDMTLLEKITELARFFSATVHVIVFEETDRNYAVTPEHLTLHIQQYVEFLRKTFPYALFEGRLLEGTSFEGAIERYCIQNEIDMIALITQPKSLWDKILQKSVSRKMAFHSRIPIFAIPRNKRHVVKA